MKDKKMKNKKNSVTQSSSKINVNVATMLARGVTELMRDIDSLSELGSVDYRLRLPTLSEELKSESDILCVLEKEQADGSFATTIFRMGDGPRTSYDTNRA